MRRNHVARSLTSAAVLFGIVAGQARSGPVQSDRASTSASSRRYDSLTDTTFITLKGLSLLGQAGEPTGLTLRVFASFQGDGAPREPVISLGWLSTSGNWQYSNDLLILTLDGAQEVRIGPLRHEWTTTTDGAVFGQLWTESSLQLLVDLSRATRIDGVLGKSRFVLTTQQLGALRSLVADLSPQTTR